MIAKAVHIPTEVGRAFRCALFEPPGPPCAMPPWDTARRCGSLCSCAREGSEGRARGRPGFAYREQRFQSLSEVARRITGTRRSISASRRRRGWTTPSTRSMSNDRGARLPYIKNAAHEDASRRGGLSGDRLTPFPGGLCPDRRNAGPAERKVWTGGWLGDQDSNLD